MSDTESLSAEDLKNKLYHSLREKGLVDALKSQLRNRLITELKQVGVSQDFVREPLHKDEGSLLHRAADSLVADHLRRCRYDYSLSVFLPECGIPQDKLFTTKDLLQLLNISPQSSLYKTLGSENNVIHLKGFLWQLLCEISRQHGNSMQESGCQTDGFIPPQDSLVERFQRLDEQYASLGSSRGPAVEERILAYQRMLDERTRTEYNLEVARFKEQELARMRLEERENTRLELEAARREMERSYQTKSDALLGRERHSIERLQKQSEIQERETYAQRQSILEEIQTVRSREGDLKRQADLHTREKLLLEEKLKSREDQVKKREDATRRAELEHQQKLADEITKFKLEEQSRLLDRVKDLDFREMRVKEDERRVGDDLRDIKQVKDELREKRIRVHELEADLHRTKHELIGAQKQAEQLGERCREMVDYQMLKEENAVVKRELDSCKQRLAEAQRDTMIERQKQEELLREMSEKAGRPTPEVYMLQKELEKVRAELRQEQAVADHDKIHSTTRIHEELDRNKDMVRRYEEQTLQQSDMNHEISDLRQQLFHFKQALNNEMYRNPKIPAAGRRSPSLCDVDDISNTEDLTQAPVAVPSSEAFQFRRQSEEEEGVNSVSEDTSYSTDLVQETKRRLRTLEAEADNLEQNYRNFQFRMTTVIPNEAINKSSNNIGLSTPRRNVSTYGSRSSPITKTQLTTPVRSSASLSALHRPLSSTPTKAKNGRISRKVSFIDGLNRPGGHGEDTDDKPAFNMSVSTVRSVSPVQQDILSSASTRNVGVSPHKVMSLSDLEARPGEASIMMVESSHFGTEHPITDTFPTQRVSPSGQEGSESSAAVGPVSLDSAWKKKEDDEAERKRQEEEDREFEERMRKREEERKRKEQEAWEREQKALQEMERDPSAASSEKQEEVKEEENTAAPSDEPAIDPVMQKYMEMVAQQKDKEKQQTTKITKKAVGLWSKGRTFSEDKTPEPSLSEDLSAADKSVEQNSDGDFEW